MSAPDFARIKQLFLAASELPEEERAAFLDAQNNLDLATRQAVEGQLAQLHENERGILAMQRARTGSDDDQSAEPDETIDRYQLLQKLGEGGFGTVWMAQQLEPVRRKVAVKIIKLGMDTKQVINRFEAERQALALMDHPNIARVFDGGATHSGRPFFAMELVRGIPITDYCEQAQLNVQQRLALFQKVCHAVQHAHQRGVIHRDLKPGNVLVTLQDGEPIPKVIDFGIAKATSAELTQQTLFTELHQLVGTPEYMAPEQAELSSLDVDTRADVYSLGVVLYELLTGSPPFDVRQLLERGYAEMLRVIREDDPPKPSTRMTEQRTVPRDRLAKPPTDAATLPRWARRDLDWIAMKALDKVRDRRYGSASALAADIERHLDHQPVLASPPSAGYRLRKFLRRHRIRVAAAALVTVSLIAGTVSSLLFAFDAGSQRDAALGARESLKSLIQVMQHADPFLSDDPRVPPKAALDRAAQLVGPAFADDPHAEADIRKTLGAGYWQQGDHVSAKAQLDRAADLLLSLPDITASEQHSLLLMRTFVMWHRGQFGLRDMRLKETRLAAIEAIAGDNVVVRRLLLEMLAWANQWRFPLGEEGAQQHWQQVLESMRDVPSGDPRWTAAATFTWYMTNVGWRFDDWQGATRWVNETLRIHREHALLRSNHMLIAFTELHRMHCLLSAGDLAELKASAQRSAEKFAPVLPPDHWLPAVFEGWNALATLREDPGNASVVKALHRTVEELETMSGPAPEFMTAALLGLVEAVRADPDADPGPVRERLLHTMSGSQLRVGLPMLEFALDDEQTVSSLRVLKRLWEEGVWSDAYRAEVRAALSETIRSVARLSPGGQLATAQWLMNWSIGHIEKAQNQPFADRVSREDLGELNRFLLAALKDSSASDRQSAHVYMSQYCAHVENDREAALRHARACSALEEEALATGSLGWGGVILGLRLLELGEPVEAVAELERAARQMAASDIDANVFVNYGYRHLMRAHLHAAEAQGDLQAGAIKASKIAEQHLRELVRGGASADALNNASWFLLLPPSIDGDARQLADRAVRESLETAERFCHDARSVYAETVNTMALAHLRSQRWGEAITTARRAIELRKQRGYVPAPLDHVFLAMGYMGRGERDQALDALRLARTLRTDDPESPHLPTKLLFAEAERVLGVR